jgi:hypothetical protein
MKIWSQDHTVNTMRRNTKSCEVKDMEKTKSVSLTIGLLRRDWDSSLLCVSAYCSTIQSTIRASKSSPPVMMMVMVIVIVIVIVVVCSGQSTGLTSSWSLTWKENGDMAV